MEVLHMDNFRQVWFPEGRLIGGDTGSISLNCNPGTSPMPLLSWFQSYSVSEVLRLNSSLWIFMGLKLGWPCSKPMASRFDTLNLAVALPMERSVGRFGCVIFGCTSCGNKMRHCWAIAATSLPHHLQLLYTWGCCFWSSSYKDRCIKHNQ